MNWSGSASRAAQGRARVATRTDLGDVEFLERRDVAEGRREELDLVLRDVEEAEAREVREALGELGELIAHEHDFLEPRVAEDGERERRQRDERVRALPGLRLRQVQVRLCVTQAP